MADQEKKREFTFLAVLLIVSGSAILSHLPHHSNGSAYSRVTGIDYSDWEPWVGTVFLSVGITYFLLNPPWNKR